MIVADASWILALRDPNDAHHERSVEIAAEVGSQRVIVAALTFAECLIGPAKMGVLDDAAHALRMSFEVVDSDSDAPLRWAALRAETGLRLPDVVVLDAAVHFGAEAIATFDDKLADRAETSGFEVLGR